MTDIKKRLKIKDLGTPGHFWQVSQSGKVLEFSAAFDMEKNPNRYRLGVIQIGRIIQNIEVCGIKQTSRPQIQLFPNLAEKQLVATVYWPEFLNQSISFDSTETNPKELTSNVINPTAKDFGFKIITKSGHENSRKAGQTGANILLTSESNHPFTWLKLGNFIQKLVQFSGGNTEKINEMIEIISPKKLSPAANKQCYIQAYLFFT